MKEAKILIYDGSFNGFLTAVFKAFDEHLEIADIQKNSAAQRGLFSDTETVFTQMDMARRVWNGVQKKSTSVARNVYFAFLSETKGIEMELYRYIRKLFSQTHIVKLNFSDDTAIKLEQLANTVAREKHKIETFMGFQLTQDSVYVAHIEPDFDILPLISKHFRSRFGSQQWLIYDKKRKYGIFYNIKSVEIVSLDLNVLHTMYVNNIRKNDLLSTEVPNFNNVWNNFFKHTNIKSLINTKLHKQPVSKPHLRYLNNKQAV